MVKSNHHDVQGQPYLDSVSHGSAYEAVDNSGILLEGTGRSPERGGR